MNTLLDETLAAPRPDGLESLLRLGLPVLDAETANARIVELEAELMRLQAIIDRRHFVTAPQVIFYLENLASKLISTLERQCVRSTIATVKRLAADPGAVAWWQPRVKAELDKIRLWDEVK